MPWDPFLMKILLKKEVCRSYKQCTRPTEKATSHIKALKKKMQTIRTYTKWWTIMVESSYLSTLLYTIANTSRVFKMRTKRKFMVTRLLQKWWGIE